MLLMLGCERQSYKGYNNIYRLSSKGGHYGRSGPYKMPSQNGKFVMESIPFEHISLTSKDLCSGITKVYKLSNDSLVYTIDRYFGLDNSFFSSNGRSVAYVNNFWRESSRDSCSTSILEFYKDGKLIKDYLYEDLLETDPEEEFSWLFWDSKINETLVDNNHYSIDDFLYLIPEKTGTVIIADLNNGEIITEIDTANYLKNIERIEFLPPTVEFIPVADVKYFPNLSNGKAFRDGLKEALNIELISLDEVQKGNRYYFTFRIESKIDKSGKSFEIKVSSPEHVLIETAEELKVEIHDYISDQRFQVDSIPYDLSFWRYEDMFYLSRNPRKSAQQDLDIYRVKVCEIDSLAGVYIPIDLVDAHKELDEILSDSTKLQIKNGEQSHFGLGMWLRNNWGLWKGGRLRCFFVEKELFHPDHISSLIITSYQMKLNNQKTNLDSLIMISSKAEKEWREN